MFLSLFIALLATTFFNHASAKALGDDLSLLQVRSVYPGHEDYANASKPYNTRYQPQPQVITYPTTVKEVSEIVQVGAKYNMSVTARSGGHSYIAAALSGSIVIDTSALKSFNYSSETKKATIGSGNTLGDVALKLNQWGRAIPHGSCSYVGLGGHSSFGGFGMPSRMWGLTMDSIEEIQGVLANGTIVTTSSTKYPELFWAQRGAAPSFTIITEFTFKTYAIPQQNVVYKTDWSVTEKEASEIIMSFQKFAKDPALPSTFGGQLNISPEKTEGRVYMSLSCAVFDATMDQFNKVLKPFLSSLPHGINERSEPAIVEGSWFNAMETILGSLNTTDPTKQGHNTFYSKSLVIPEGEPLKKEQVNTWAALLGKEGFRADFPWTAQIELYGGAHSKINSVPEPASAFRRRDSLFTFKMTASSNTHAPPYPNEGYKFLDSLVESLGNNKAFSAYTNYADDRLENWQDKYYGGNYEGLRYVKRVFDPKNVFKYPMSIEL